MKKLILLAITGFAIAFSGCQSGINNNPKEVLSQFFQALTKKDVAAAKKFATKDSEGMLNMVEMGMKMSANMQNDHEDKMFEMMKNVEMADPVINGDKATIKVTDKKSGESVNFQLQKEEGSWKVAFNMGALMDMGKDEMKKHGMDETNMDSMSSRMNEAMDSLNKNMPDMKEKMEQAKKMMEQMNKEGK